MRIEKFEVWVHDNILKNNRIRKIVYGFYQRALYALSPKIKSEGDIERAVPEDGYEYLFGYYDKCPWSDDGKHLLALRVKNSTAEADSSQEADLVLIELISKKVEKIATTHSWNVQQGCMAQWISESEILYNDYRNEKYCSVVLNLLSKTERVIDFPVYAVSRDRTTALSLDFSRLHRLRPGYGYVNIPDATEKEKCPDKACIWKIDLISGAVTPLLKYTDFASFEPKENMYGAEHKVNHLMINPSGNRFMVLHRWFQNGVKFTRLVTCNMDGTDMYNLSDDDFVSHCCWKNDEEILSYLNKKNGGKGYYLMKDKTQEYEHVWLSLIMDGHPTYSYDGKFVVTDTYPNRIRLQSLYVMCGRKVKRVARVFSPFRFGGDVRCDLHPRWSKDGKQICFDGSFEGKRGIYFVNLSKSREIVKHTIIAEETPKVSVVIPCYNCADFIDETLESLESQTFKDFEVVCVNDGSSDSTIEKLENWKRKGTLSVVIVDQVNGGVSNARNNGMAVSKGRFLAFLDADDMYHEEFLERLVDSKEKSDVDVSYCRLNRNYDNVMSYEADDDKYVVQTQKEAMDNLLYRMGEFGFYCYLYDRTILKNINLKFDENTKFGEDREFNWKYLAHCHTFAFVDKPLYWYRPNAVSATKGKASWRKTDLLNAVTRIEKYLDDEKCAYADEFKSYMYARAAWAVAKTFAVSGDKELYNRLIKEYSIKKCMKRTARDRNKLVRIASIAYLVNPSFFYKIVRLKK